MSRFYWIIAVLLVAVVTHLSFVLFAPKLVMADKLDAMRAFTGEASLKVLSPEDALRLVGPEEEGLVHAICVYDLAHGPVRIVTVIPPSYWSISIYSEGGDNFYSFNDRQADVDSLALLLKPAVRRLVPAEETEAVAPEGDTLEVLAPDERGVVVLRALASEPAERSRIAEILSRSSCAGSKI